MNGHSTSGAVFWTDEYSDGVDYASVLTQHLGLSIRAMQLSYGKGHTRFAAFRLPREGFALGWSRILEAQFMEFEVPAGWTLVSFSPNGRSYCCNGVHLEGATLSIYPEGRYSGSYPVKWESVDVLVQEEFVRRLVGESDSAVHDAPDSAPLVVTDCGERGQALFARLQTLFQEAEETRDTSAHGQLAQEAINLLTGDLDGVIGEAFAQQVAGAYRKSRRPDLLDQARALLEANPGVEFSAEEIAERLGVSYRTMHYAFDDALQLSPYQFFLIQRLNELRETLKTTDLSVKEACYAHGFRTLSRFRRQYRRLFGELPSATRAAAGRRAGKVPGKAPRPTSPRSAHGAPRTTSREASRT